MLSDKLPGLASRFEPTTANRVGSRRHRNHGFANDVKQLCKIHEFLTCLDPISMVPAGFGGGGRVAISRKHERVSKAWPTTRATREIKTCRIPTRPRSLRGCSVSANG